MSDKATPPPKVHLRLYVIAGAPNSSAARANLDAILAEIGADRFAVEIIDCVAQPLRALNEGVIVTPTLVKSSPPPTQTIIGTLSDRVSVAAALQLDTIPHVARI